MTSKPKVFSDWNANKSKQIIDTLQTNEYFKINSAITK